MDVKQCADNKQSDMSKRIPFTLTVLILCPALCLASFIVPMSVLCVAGAVVAVAYAVCLRPRPAAMMRTLTPAVVYFAALCAAGAIQQAVWHLSGGKSPIAEQGMSIYQWMRQMCILPAARTSLAIAVSSLVSTAAYTVTSDLERREALTCAEEKVRHIFHMRPTLTAAPALSLLSSFIPMACRVWSEVDEARRARGMTIVNPAVLASFISVCMQKAVETGEVIRARSD